ncbi:bacterioferritin [Halobacteriovorax marinus]|uniref:Bacterioferritin n=1 Tax=Halobacteriovorax marinus (strain ATCC BAA-682 / DSM 15412 / SJ) TaxID=862908 RepID=E1X3L7_HALMS|nr:bacterioferritin [Halobacteriovorax marinus]ATH08269.1 bacterioferritin [Halobacteriovorax marinus]CBW26946.1 bacterioferritin [Halobacteriovorax marinus SJ]
MKGDKEIIEALNNVLANELTAINQYFLHARMLDDWGLEKLGKLEYDASIDEMKHADEIIKRILFLEGLPNLQKLNRLKIGQNIEELIAADLEVEYKAVPELREYISLCEKKQDYITRDILKRILDSEEEHIDWLETQQSLIKQVGIQNFIQSQISE